MSLTQTANHMLFRVLTRNWSRNTIDHYVKRLAGFDEESPTPNLVGRNLQIIDNKASGLLTHTSMMIAALGISAPVVADNHFEQGVIIIEIMLYLLVALGCLRCLAVFHDASTREVKDAARDELILRRELFRLCIRSAIFLTLLVLISLPLLYLYVPGKG
jgi:hypothetical protein